MKKASLILILLFLPVFLFSEYTEQQWLQFGNNFYKQKTYNKAAYCYEKVLLTNPNNTTALLYGGYSYLYLNNAQKGIVYVEKVYQLTGNANVKAQLDKLNQKYGAIQPPAIENKKEITLLQWIVYGVDVALLGATAYTYFDSSSSADKYNELHTQIDNTTKENFDKLTGEYSKAQAKENAFALIGSITGVALLYTSVDMLLLHWAFPIDVACQQKDEETIIVVRKDF